MNKHTIYIDYDGTMNALAHDWLVWANYNFNTNYSLEDVTDWYWYNNNFTEEIFDYFKIAYDIKHKFSVKPLEESREFFKWVSTRYNTYILTSTHPNEKLREDKEFHINYHYNTDAVIHEHHKYKYSGINKVLVDDRLHNILLWVLKGGIGIHYNHNNEYRYNEECNLEHDNLYYAYNYDQVKDIIKGLDCE